MKIALVRVNYKPWWSKRRKWIPVYFHAHCDPELSKQAANLHYHIAWNRLRDNFTHLGKWSNNRGVVVWAENVVELKIPKRQPPIIGKSHAVIDWKNNRWMPFPEAWKKLTPQAR